MSIDAFLSEPAISDEFLYFSPGCSEADYRR